MVLFFPMQQELDCISDSGDILGKIRFDGTQQKHIFDADDKARLSAQQQKLINQKLATLDGGKHVIPMQDDD